LNIKLLVFRVGEKWLAVVDGKGRGEYHKVKDLTFSPDSARVAYSARVGGKWFMVLDGQAGTYYDGLGDLTFSPDGQRLAYGAQLGDRYFVVVEGQESEAYDSVVLSGAGGRIIFDTPGTLRYLAIRGDGIYSVDEAIQQEA
jgi:hypothetical protein